MSVRWLLDRCRNVAVVIWRQSLTCVDEQCFGLGGRSAQSTYERMLGHAKLRSAVRPLSAKSRPNASL